MNIYHFKLKDNCGNIVSLADYKGKALLIVNTATECGLTPQYAALQKLYDQYREQGLEILDFPCNQFMEQAPGTNEEINEFCLLNYKTTFPRFAKIEVNGFNAEPLYRWLKEQAPEDRCDDVAKAFEEKIAPLTRNNKAGDIKWNFGKFLINQSGYVAARYYPTYPLEKLEQDIQALLCRCDAQDAPMTDDKHEQGLIQAFQMMWGNYPEPVALIHRSFRVVAGNDTYLKIGGQTGGKCNAVNPELHRGCKAMEALKEQQTKSRAITINDTEWIAYWVPVRGCEDYYVHFTNGMKVFIEKKNQTETEDC